MKQRCLRCEFPCSTAESLSRYRIDSSRAWSGRREPPTAGRYTPHDDGADLVGDLEDSTFFQDGGQVEDKDVSSTEKTNGVDEARASYESAGDPDDPEGEGGGVLAEDAAGAVHVRSPGRHDSRRRGSEVSCSGFSHRSARSSTNSAHSPGDWVSDERVGSWYEGVQAREDGKAVLVQRRNSRNKEFIATSKERMEQRNARHKQHITRLNNVRSGRGGIKTSGSGGSLSGRGTPPQVPAATAEKQEQLARRSAELAEARTMAAVKAAEERIAARRAKVDAAHKERLRQAVPDTLAAESGWWERQRLQHGLKKSSVRGAPRAKRLGNERR